MQPVEVTDKKGRVWLADPARHLFRDGLPRVNPHTGVPMPRGGRKPNVAGVATSETSPTPPAAAASPAPVSSPATNAGAGSPPAPAAATPPQPAAPPPEPSFADIAPLLKDAAPGPDAEPKPKEPAGPDRSDDAAEVFCRCVQLFCGFLFGAADDCRLPASEHKDMVQATAAWVRYRGWQFSATAAFVLVWCGYLLRILDKPKPAAKVREWFGLGTVKNVTPTGGPSPVRAAAGPAASAPIINLPPTSKLG